MTALRCPMGENRICEGSMCAWWHPQESACSVLVGAKALRILAASTRKPKTETQRSCHNCRHERNSSHGYPPCAYCSQHSNWQPVDEPQAEPQPKPAPAPKRVVLNEDTLKPDTTPPSVCVPHIQGDPGKRTDDYRDNGDVAGAAMRQAAGRKGTDASPWKKPPKKKPHLPQLVTYGGDWNAVELVDAYRAMTEAPSDACESAENVDDATCSVDETPQNVNAEYKSVDKPARTIVCDVCGKPFTKTTKGRDPKTCREPECIKALHRRQAKSRAMRADAI